MTPDLHAILMTSDTNRHREYPANATIEQLDEYLLQACGNEHLHRMASAERERRHFQQLRKPHWVIWATFVAGAIAAIAAMILLFR
jgi:hypothetical protein